jgi:hypothetical protein
VRSTAAVEGASSRAGPSLKRLTSGAGLTEEASTLARAAAAAARRGGAAAARGGGVARIATRTLACLQAVVICHRPCSLLLIGRERGLAFGWASQQAEFSHCWKLPASSPIYGGARSIRAGAVGQITRTGH